MVVYSPRRIGIIAGGSLPGVWRYVFFQRVRSIFPLAGETSSIRCGIKLDLRCFEALYR